MAVGLYVTVTVQLVPDGTELLQVVEATVAVPAVVVTAPDTDATTLALEYCRGKSPSLVRVATTV
jgi:hypothetical protein